MRRAARRAEARARARSQELAERILAEAPQGIAAEAAEEGVRLAGRDLKRGFAIEPRLRWLVKELIR